ncbi:MULTISPECIES: DUF7344 domain-containing protein [Haloferacaceae]|uniref:DUF7344 domain-containing protein n=1 Tax=Halorubrum glutamatedens TaxID=2707018 RepID=A0ABD5QS60_9EURY|nr:hypothetical protein [Halobellus captivus]
MNETEKLTKDEVFEVLSSSRRRQILYHLHRRGGEADLRDLARDTAGAEKVDPITDDVVKRLYISLYQTHVPKLEKVGVVRYDSDDKSVVLTNRVTDIARVLNVEIEPSRQWSLYYALLAVTGLGLSLAQLSGFAPSVTTLPFVVVLLLLAMFQYYETEIREHEYDFLERIVSD